MNYITADSLSLARGGKTLFEDINFSIENRDHIAIVGLNGCGKSSLLAILAGKLEQDSGNVTRNSDCRVHMMEQMPKFNGDDSIIDYVFSSFTLPHISTIKKYEKVILKIENNWSDDLQEELDSLSAEMDRLDAWEFEGRLKALLTQFGVPSLESKMSSLSGGMIRKLSLAQAIMAEPELIILDEPTNHLDIETILWLQEFLSKWNRAFLIVTHDRYFLDQVCSVIWEIDRGELAVFRGNFTYYLEKKQEIAVAQKRKDEKIGSLLKKEIEWMNRSPCARGTKQKARIDRVNDMMKVGTVKEQSRAEMSTSGRKLGKKVVNLKNASFSFGDNKIVEDFSYNFKRNEKIGLVGENGVGKSSFINLIIGKLEEQSGYIDRGVNTDFGLFSQIPTDMPSEMPIFKYLKSFAEVIELKGGEKITAGAMLERFLFDKDSHFKQIENLSGGERRRLQLLTVLIKNPNFLILDEPTNDLDIHTLSVLEEFLLEFTGSLLIVSHDRFFLDRVTDYLLVMEGEGRVFGFPSSYSDYILYSIEKKKEAKLAKKVSKKTEPSLKKEKSKKLSFKEKRELEEMEQKVEDLELKKDGMEQDFATITGADAVTLKQDYDKLNIELETAMNRWEELSLIAENN
jgi:ATP-binding cassette subfamily F protein uup